MGFKSLMWAAAAAAFIVDAAHAQAAPKKWTSSDLAAAERCLGFVLMGPDTGGISIHGDDYDCKPVGDITIRAGGWMEVTSEISHELTLRPDDELKFKILFTADGRMRYQTTENEGGVFGPILPDEAQSWWPVHIPANLETMSSRDILAMAAAENDYPSRWWCIGEVVAEAAALELVRSQKMKMQGPAYFVDRLGHDLRHFELVNGQHYGANDINSNYPRTYVDACASSCDQDGQCRAWSMARAGKKRICWLKTSGTEPTMDRNAVSGVKAAPNLPPITGYVLKTH